MNISSEHLAKRLLIKQDVYLGQKYEVVVIEISPSKKYAKLKFIRSDETFYNSWVLVEDYKIIEDLGYPVQYPFKRNPYDKKNQKTIEKLYKKYSTPKKSEEHITYKKYWEVPMTGDPPSDLQPRSIC